MKKISIEVNNTEIIFSFNKSSSQQTTIDTSNIESLDKINCSYEYILKNMGSVITFLKNSSNRNHPTKLIVEKYSLTGLIIKLTEGLESIDTIVFKEKETLSQGVYDLIIDDKLKINTLECYNIDKQMLNNLKNKGIKVILKNEITFINTFMKDNNFNTHADLYGKTHITFNKIPNEYDLDDFNNFLKLNKSLTTVDIKKYDDIALAKILGILLKNKRKHVTINIYENNNDIVDRIKTFKKIKKRYKKYFKFKIIYSESYKAKNKTKKIISNIITVILILIILSVIIYFLHAFISKKHSENLSAKINKYKEETLKEENETKDTKKIESIYDKDFTKVISELKNLNEETVGWLNVNNTKIDYPVVKHDNNEFYLTHDFEKKYNIYGWVFMDYRNNAQTLDQNTIIYGHDSGNVTFGTLYKVLNKSWYTNKNNQIITFNTASENIKWQIFSIYKIKETNDYLTTEFEDEKEYTNFLNLLKNRSIHNFNVNINSNDKILTLSTCYGDTERLVVHAKKIS